MRWLAVSFSLIAGKQHSRKSSNYLYLGYIYIHLFDKAFKIFSHENSFVRSFVRFVQLYMPHQEHTHTHTHTHAR